MKRFTRSIAFAACLSLLSTGCFGKFQLVRKVYELNAGIDNKILRTLVFWAFVIVPVYGVAAFVDAVVFNLIDFWGGGGNPHVENLPDGTELKATRLSATVLRIERIQDGKVIETLELEQLGDGAGQLRRNGEILVQAELLPDGSMRMNGVDGERTVSAERFAAAASQVASGDRVAALSMMSGCGGELAAR